MKNILVAFAAALTLAACAVGTPIKWDNARQVQIGMSESEVTALMGKPYMVASRPDGQRWVWTLATSFGRAESMSIDFKDGKVAVVPPIPPSFR